MAATPPRQYIEDSLAAVKAHLDTDGVLRAKLGQIAAEREIKLPEPSIVAIGPDRRNRHPKLELLPDTTGHDYAFEDAPFIFPWLEHTIVAQVTHTGGSVNFVMDTIMRYVEALERIHEDDDTFGQRFNRVRLGEADYSPLVEDQNSRLIRQVLTVELICRTR